MTAANLEQKEKRERTLTAKEKTRESIEWRLEERIEGERAEIMGELQERSENKGEKKGRAGKDELRGRLSNRRAEERKEIREEAFNRAKILSFDPFRPRFAFKRLKNERNQRGERCSGWGLGNLELTARVLDKKAKGFREDLGK